MRALKTILIIVAALVGLLLILGLTGPKTSEVKRSVVINAKPETIYPMISSLKEAHQWGPWIDMEKDIKGEWSGEDGTIGSSQSWEGDTLGTGSQKIIAMEENKKVQSELRLDTWGMVSDIDLDLTPLTDSTTQVDWILRSRNDNIMKRMMARFTDMDKAIGPDFSRGLEKLKIRAEEKQMAANAEFRSKNFRGYTIETVEMPAKTYIGKRNPKLKWTEFEKFYGANFGGAYGAVGAAGLKPTCCPSGIFFAWNEQDQTADVMAGVPIEGGDDNTKVKGWETYTVPASKMLHIKYYGGYDKSMEAHMAMDDMIKANGLTHYGNVVEEYITDPSQEPDTAKWLTNIYYMVR